MSAATRAIPASVPIGGAPGSWPSPGGAGVSDAAGTSLAGGSTEAADVGASRLGAGLGGAKDAAPGVADGGIVPASGLAVAGALDGAAGVGWLVARAVGRAVAVGLGVSAAVGRGVGLGVGRGVGASVGLGAAGGAMPGGDWLPVSNAQPSTLPGAGREEPAPALLYAQEPPRSACQ